MLPELLQLGASARPCPWGAHPSAQPRPWGARPSAQPPLGANPSPASPAPAPRHPPNPPAVTERRPALPPPLPQRAPSSICSEDLTLNACSPCLLPRLCLCRHRTTAHKGSPRRQGYPKPPGPSPGRMSRELAPSCRGAPCSPSTLTRPVRCWEQGCRVLQAISVAIWARMGCF